MRQIKAGTVDVSVVIRIVDSGDGTPETGVVAATAGLVLEYRRELAASVSLATIVDLAALTTAHTDKGIKAIGNGYYRLDLVDAACATGVTGVLIHGTATGMVVMGEYIELVAYDPYDAVRAGLTALPNAAADAAGGLPISDAGGLDLDAVGAAVTSGTHGNAALKTLIDAVDNFIDTEVGDIQARLPAALTAGGNMKADALAISGDATAADNFETMLDGTGGQTLSLGRLVINNTAASAAVEIVASHAAGPSAFTVTSTGSAASFSAGSGGGAGNALIFTAQNGHGITTTGGGAGNSGLYVVAGASHAAQFYGTGGAGIYANAQTGNHYGIAAYGSGNESGFYAKGGATGAGAEFKGGDTSGDAVKLLTTDGHGITGTLGGSNKKLINGTVLLVDTTTTNTDMITAAGIRTAVGLASANLDTQLDALPTNAELATALGTADDAVLIQVALVKAKTDNLPTDPADQSLVIAATDAIVAAIAALNNLSSAQAQTAAAAALTAYDPPTNAEMEARTLVAASYSTLTAAQVNTEVLDVVNVDTFGEPTGVPGATITLREKIGWVFMALRNGLTVTGSKKQFLDDSGAAEWEKDIADDGTQYTESKANSP